jgi:hypothetical protein
MTREEKEILWIKLCQFEFDDPSSSFTFTDRLARDNGWTIEFTLRTIEEYRKFIYLICISNQALTPSDQVDQVWHLHLLYTQSYWHDLCNNTIKRQIHHGPTQGGKMEMIKYFDHYENTKVIYFEEFKSIPPIDIWPSSEVRFKQINFQRINLDTNWVIKKKIF